MTKQKIDILLLARPDHSLYIYQSLEDNVDLKFHFLTFRVLKKFWAFCGLKKVAYVNKHVSILKLLTLRHILKYNFNKFVNLNESKYFEKGTRHILSKYSPRIIHYWPSYCYREIEKYKKEHPEVITIADQYMPNPIYVMTVMKSIYEKYGMTVNNAYLEKYSRQIVEHFNGADYIAVPSKFVEDTMKMTFPNHKYLRIPYGITISNLYNYKFKTDKVKNFVYVGGISLEKGVDIILEYFSKHKELELHLYGQMKSTQQDVFTPYTNCENIHFHGPVSKEELKQAFCKMDIGIHPSRFDAYSLAVGEEIGAGLPVIVSENTGILEDIRKNNWGLGFALDDIEALDKAVKEMTNLDKYNSLKKSIDDYIKSNHNSYGEEMVDCYKQILSNRLCK